MIDIKFDITIRDCPLNESGDFIIEQNASVQNGGILLYSESAILSNPILGIGYNEEIMENNPTFAASQLNRWNEQIAADGGKSNWQRINSSANIFTFDANVNYPQ